MGVSEDLDGRHLGRSRNVQNGRPDRVDIAGIEQSLVSAFSRFPTNLSTCSGLLVVRGTSEIAAGSGTGSYRGIHGGLKMTVTINEVDSWPKCPRTGQGLLAESVFLTASGIVSFK